MKYHFDIQEIYPAHPNVVVTLTLNGKDHEVPVHAWGRCTVRVEGTEQYSTVRIVPLIFDPVSYELRPYHVVAGVAPLP